MIIPLLMAMALTPADLTLYKFLTKEHRAGMVTDIIYADGSDIAPVIQVGPKFARTRYSEQTAVITKMCELQVARESDVPSKCEVEDNGIHVGTVYVNADVNGEWVNTEFEVDGWYLDKMRTVTVMRGMVAK